MLILITPKTSSKASRHLRALAAARPDVPVSSDYRDCDVLMLYGLGGQDRLDVAMAHLAKGRPFITWDLGYWDRNALPRKFRFSINSNHPDSVMLGAYPGPDRYEASGLGVANVADPAGPIMLVGHGAKSNAVWTKGWAAEKSKELTQAFPGRRVVYRPKPNHPYEPGVECHTVSVGPIDRELRGVSLVVCRHSNVAVDACRNGVPVVCEAGAAAAIYPSSLADAGRQPDAETRLEFLHRLAWWQWSADEAEQAWQFIEGKLCEST